MAAGDLMAPKTAIVTLTRQEVQEYLDKCIESWRRNRDKARAGSAYHEMATHYVDAYQSARISLIGELLP